MVVNAPITASNPTGGPDFASAYNASHYYSVYGELDGSAVQGTYRCWIEATLSSRKMSLYSPDNSADANRTCTLYENGIGVNQTITIPALTTGWFVDTTNTDTHVAGDYLELFVGLAVGGTAGTTHVRATSIDIVDLTTDRYWTFMGATGNRVYTDNFTYYPTVNEGHSSLTTEISSVEIRHPATWTDLRFTVQDNSIGATSTVASRINGADGNQTLNILSKATGDFGPSAGEDSLSIGDHINYRLSVASAGGVKTMGMGWWTSNLYHPRYFSLFMTGYETVNINASVFYSTVGRTTYTLPDEIPRYIRFNIPGNNYKVDQGTVQVSANSTNTAQSFRSRVNGANGNISITIAAGTTGYFRDTTNSEILDNTDDLNWKFDWAGGTGALTIQNASLRVANRTPASEDLFAKFTVSSGIPSGSDDLFAKFEVKNINTKDLFSKFTIRQTGIVELYGHTIITIPGSVEIYCHAEIRQETSAELYASFEITSALLSSSAETYGHTIIRKIGSAEIYSHAIIRQLTSVDLYVHIIIKNIASAEAYAHLVIRQPISLELYGHADIQHPATEEIYAHAIIKQPGSAELYAHVEIRQEIPAELYASFVVQTGLLGSAELYGLVEIQQPASAELYGHVIIKNIDSAEVYGLAELRQPASAEIYGTTEIRQETSVDLYALFIVKNISFAELYGHAEVQQPTSVELYAHAIIKNTASAAAYAHAFIKTADSAEIYGHAEIQHPDSADLYALFIIRQPASAEIYGTAEIRNIDSAEAYAHAIIRHPASAELFAHTVIKNIASAEAYAHLVIRQPASAELYGHAEIRHPDLSEIYAHTIIRNIGFAEAYAHFIVKNISFAELYGHAEIRHPASADLYARTKIRHPGVPVELYGYGIIRNIDSAELYAHAVIKNIDFAEVYSRTKIRHPGIPVELYGHAIIRHPASEDVYAHTIIKNIDSADAYAHFIVRNLSFAELYASFSAQVSLNLLVKFVVRHPYRLWTNRRYLNGVVELDEENLGDALLEYVIEGVMNDIKSRLIREDLTGYVSWTDITKTPKLIRRATTYATVATLYARDNNNPLRRIVLGIRPLAARVVQERAAQERAMDYWEEKFEKTLALFATSQSKKLMIVDTADEEPVFSMEELPFSTEDPYYIKSR